MAIRFITAGVLVAALAWALGCATFGQSASTDRLPALPDPAVDEPTASAHGERSVVVAGGCFWGIQAVFQHVKGVKSATSGYSGGRSETAHYEMVSEGTTGHAESVRIVYDPSQVTLGRLLKVFFGVAHDPTEKDRQGPDVGSQYRSVVFCSDADQRRIAEAYVRQLDGAHAFGAPIVTEVATLSAFYPAESYHQDYARHHPESAYIQRYDLPKVASLRQQFPELYVAKE